MEMSLKDVESTLSLLNSEYDSLLKEADEIALRYSNLDRSKNFNGESFVVDKIFIESEYIASVVFQKSSGKKALALFYFVKNDFNRWYYFFPSDSHLLGLRRVEDRKCEVENFNLNVGVKK
jgi:hypothetical protein